MSMAGHPVIRAPTLVARPNFSTIFPCSFGYRLVNALPPPQKPQKTRSNDQQANVVWLWNGLNEKVEAVVCHRREGLGVVISNVHSIRAGVDGAKPPLGK